jgi:1,4-dihydroxy-2-naphthoate octaprenyltransferase
MTVTTGETMGFSAKQTNHKGLYECLGPFRLPFLLQAVSCVVLGWGCAVWTAGTVSVLQLVLVFIGAVAAQMSVNAFNEYYDFKCGLDYITERTPFSGGSGVLPQSPRRAPYVYAAAVVTLCCTASVGVYFVYMRGIALLPLGLFGLLLVYGYSVWCVKRAVACLIAPGLGFGPLMVMGAVFALTGAYSVTVFVASLVPFFFVSNLLLLNQYPDIAADRSVGRRNLPLLIGPRRSSIVYAVFSVLGYAVIVGGVWLRIFPVWTLLGSCTAVCAGIAFIGARRRGAGDSGGMLLFLTMNVIVTVLTPVLVGIGFFIGGKP